MLIAAFFSWWYGSGWVQLIRSFRPRVHSVSQAFSASQLLRTLFAPWRRIITPPGASLTEHWRAAIDNLFSRAIGFVVRLMVLLGALLSLVLICIITLAEIILWPLLPIAIPGLIIAGFAV